MKVEVVTPEEYAGFVIGDLRSRRGHVLGQIREADSSTDSSTINALVPLANMFGYRSTLRMGTRGRATFTMSFSHYAPLPPQGGGDDWFPPAIGMRA
jgi:elongation factor G